MTNNNENMESLCSSSNHFSNLKNIPTNWKKFGEVFCKSEQPIFVCSICLQNAESINTAYTTNNGSTFWWHIQQQHFSIEYETLDKISAEIDNFDAESVDSEISYGEITSGENDLVDFSDDKMMQNSVKLLEQFHRGVVNDTMRKPQNENVVKQGTDNFEENGNESSGKDDIQNVSNLNYYYDENETYTISDDDVDDEDDDESEDTKFTSVNKDYKVMDNVKCNDMIEISDDELSEDNIETCPNSPNTFDKDPGNVEESNELESNKWTNYTDTRESNEAWTHFTFGVPAPDISQSESIPTLNYDEHFNSAQLNYNLTVYNKDSPLKQNRHRPKKSSKTFLAFQCELCGTRTANENNMKAHLERKHIGTHHDYYQHYRQLHQSYQNSPEDALSQKSLKKPFKCKSCKRRTITLKSMERHQQLYHGPDANVLAKQCNICHKRILKQKFELHVKAHFSLGFNCRYCGVVYKNKRYIESHIRKYHGDRNLYLEQECLQQHERNPNVPCAFSAATSTLANLARAQQQSPQMRGIACHQ